jgi:protein SCO1/2
MLKRSGTPSKSIFAFLLAVTVAVTAFFGWRLSSDAVVQAPEDIEDYLFWEAKDLTAFTLMGANDKTFGLNNLKGKWSFFFFGYTHCPDVCPVTLGALAMTFKILEKTNAVSPDIQGIFVSVDPHRDTPELLEEYVTYFDTRFWGVTGNTAQVDAVTRQMGALYTIHPGESGTSYLVSHNSAIFVVDPQGRLYGRFPPPHAPREMAEIFAKIVVFYDEQGRGRWTFF